MLALPAASTERLVMYGPSTNPRPGKNSKRGMLGSRPHQRPGTVPPGTSVASGLRFESDLIAVMNLRFEPRQTSVSNHLRPFRAVFGIVILNVESVVSGRTSYSAPWVRATKLSQTPIGGGAFSELSVSDVPAGGVPALALY